MFTVFGRVVLIILECRLMYKKFGKRLIDFGISLLALLLLSPLLVILTIVGFFAMKGNPFFVQERPGKNGEIFKLIKFRTMTNKKDEKGNFLPDSERLIPYGRFLRSTSLDELPELFNILRGDMAIVGPRPLLVKYLPLYNEKQKHRHDVRPGLTGLAQVNGRNSVSWSERFDLDVWYVENVSALLDVKIIFQTVITVLKREGVHSENSVTMEEFKGNV